MRPGIGCNIVYVWWLYLGTAQARAVCSAPGELWFSGTVHGEGGPREVACWNVCVECPL